MYHVLSRTLCFQSGNKQLVLSWSAPSDDGGDSIASYTVKSMDTQAVTIAQSSPIVISKTTFGEELINGEEYRYNVRASNGVGFGPESGAVSAIPLGVDAKLKTLAFSNVAGR